jgi:hypothetical protein
MGAQLIFIVEYNSNMMINNVLVAITADMNRS